MKPRDFALFLLGAQAGVIATFVLARLLRAGPSLAEDAPRDALPAPARDTGTTLEMRSLLTDEWGSRLNPVTLARLSDQKAS